MQLISLFVVSLFSLSALSVPTTEAASEKDARATPADNGACNNLLSDCIENDPNGPYAYSNIFGSYSCIMTFACNAPAQTIDEVLANNFYGAPLQKPPKSADQARLSKTLFAQHSSDGKVWTQQNFIDAYYTRLGQINGPVYPSSVDVVIPYWTNIAAWTGFCKTKAIPYQNLADWYTYSSTIKGASATC